MQPHSGLHASHQSTKPAPPISACKALGKSYPLVEDRYKVKGVFTGGGLSALYFAKDTQTGADVVLKTIGRQFRSDPAVFETMQRTLSIEAEALSRINHPGVVSLLGRSVLGDFIVLEYIHGHTLHGMPLPPEMVLGIAPYICDAVSASHEAGVIHRDLKPENILVSSRFMSNIALIDFGSAKVRSCSVEDPYIYGAVGTAAFMAPEVLDSGADADERSDTFSLSALFYDKLAGFPPFPIDPGLDFHQALEARRGMAPLPLADAAQSLPPRLCAAIDKGLGYYPDERYQSAKELKVALRGCIPSA